MDYNLLYLEVEEIIKTLLYYDDENEAFLNEIIEISNGKVNHAFHKITEYLDPEKYGENLDKNTTAIEKIAEAAKSAMEKIIF